MRAPVREDPDLPDELRGSALTRRALPIAVALGALVLVAVLAPGVGLDAGRHWLADPRRRQAVMPLHRHHPRRGPRCRRRPGRRWPAHVVALSAEAERGRVGSGVADQRAAGPDLGGGAHRGHCASSAACCSVAFFVLKSGVNFVAVVVFGVLLAIGVLGPAQPWWLTVLPALLAAIVIVAVVLAPRVGPGPVPPDDAPGLTRAAGVVRRALVEGGREALLVARRPAPALLAGAFGYWFFDNAVLWATFHAFGDAPPVTVVLMGYLIGQLGGLIPCRAASAASTGAWWLLRALRRAGGATALIAVLAYRVILFWLPLGLGVVGAAALRAPPAPRWLHARAALSGAAGGLLMCETVSSRPEG